MTKKYKISSIVYSSILVFSILFMVILFFASGHDVEFEYLDYSIPLFVLLNLTLLYVFPKISNEKRRTKIIFSILLSTFLIFALYMAIRIFFEVLSGDLIPGFIFFALTVSGIFAISIINILIEIYKTVTKPEF